MEDHSKIRKFHLFWKECCPYSYKTYKLFEFTSALIRLQLLFNWLIPNVTFLSCSIRCGHPKTRHHIFFLHTRWCKWHYWHVYKQQTIDQCCLLIYLSGWLSVEIKLRSSEQGIGHLTMFLFMKRWVSCYISQVYIFETNKRSTIVNCTVKWLVVVKHK